MCFDRNINGYRDVKFLIGIIGHCTDEKNLLYYFSFSRLGVEETMDFLHYYREDTNNNLVNLEELRKTECIEQIMNQFTTYYGVRERELCKECSYQEGRDILHSM